MAQDKLDRDFLRSSNLKRSFGESIVARRAAARSSRRLLLESERLEPRTMLTTSFGTIDVAEVQTLAGEAVAIWQAAGLTSDQLQALEQLSYEVTDLGDYNLGQYRSGIITIDDNAAGNLWFVDDTPALNDEFHIEGNSLVANDDSLAYAKIDLLTTLLHEQGHALGLTGIGVCGINVMNESLQVGLRRLPSVGQADGATPGSLTTVEYLTTDTTGGGQAFNVRQPFTAMNFVIALSGIFPSRNLSGGNDYLGSVELFAGNFAPRGYALAQGQLLTINSNQSLYSILGTTYGGDGRTTFALPDLRGRVPIGAGQGPGLSNYRLGEKSGAESVTLTVANLPAHTHDVANVGPTTSTGSFEPFNNRQPTLALTPVIVTQGLFPSHSLSSEELLGSVEWFAGNFAPRGTLLANGQLLPIAQHTALFSILGTTYGGDGRTTFGLPDLRGRMAVGAGSGPGLAPVRLGEMGGRESTTLTTTLLPSHNHGIPGTGTSTSNTGVGTSFDMRQPYLGLNYDISLFGVYPSRSLDTDEAVEMAREETIGEGFVSGNSILEESVARLLITPLMEEGIQRWKLAGIDEAQVETLQSTRLEMRDLPSGRLAATEGNVITLDRDASNRGWFVDLTPADDLEFSETDVNTGELVASVEEAYRHYDLLTAIMHEQGHVLGLEHAFVPVDLMYGGLTVGGRRLPQAADLTVSATLNSGPHFLAGSDPIIASVGMFAGNFAPRNWATADGRLLSVAQNDALFSLIGTTFGGDGRSTFGLPDLRGRAPLGVGNGPGLSNFNWGQRGGSGSHTLTIAEIPAHTHDFNQPPTAVTLTPAAATLPENTNTTNAIELATIAITDDGLGSNVLSLSGADSSHFEIVGDKLQLKAGVSLDFEVQDTYTVTVNVDDSTVGGAVDASQAFTLTVTNSSELTGIDVQSGQTQRSFVRYLDIVFDIGGSDLADLIAGNRFQLTQFDLNGENGVVKTPPTPVAVGNRLQFDFGVQGIGGNMNSNVGDGYYEIALDMDHDGSFESTQHFYRLLGDVTGDGVVDAVDRSQVLAAQGMTYSPENDVNGSGGVTLVDTTLVTRALGRSLKNGLALDD
ncbi:MAG: tail fiber protein [Planctomycetales bacterium]|nr:tail fiber protein [Planctomycetales bacterium]